MELEEVVSPHFAFPIVGVILCAFLVFAFGFKSPAQPPSFDFDEDEKKTAGKKRKIKKAQNGHVSHVSDASDKGSLQISSSPQKLASSKTKEGNAGTGKKDQAKEDKKVDQTTGLSSSLANKNIKIDAGELKATKNAKNLHQKNKISKAAETVKGSSESQGDEANVTDGWIQLLSRKERKIRKKEDEDRESVKQTDSKESSPEKLPPSPAKESKKKKKKVTSSSVIQQEKEAEVELILSVLPEKSKEELPKEQRSGKKKKGKDQITAVENVENANATETRSEPELKFPVDSNKMKPEKVTDVKKKDNKTKKKEETKAEKKVPKDEKRDTSKETNEVLPVQVKEEKKPNAKKTESKEVNEEDADEEKKKKKKKTKKKTKVENDANLRKETSDILSEPIIKVTESVKKEILKESTKKPTPSIEKNVTAAVEPPRPEDKTIVLDETTDDFRLEEQLERVDWHEAKTLRKKKKIRRDQ